VKPRKIRDNVYFVGSLHWDRQLFDELIPLPDGTTYNAYLVKGSEKTALIDAVDPEKQEELIQALRGLGVTVDYVIANHAEQDHSGGIVRVLEEFPKAKVVTNAKCKSFLQDLLHIDEQKFLVKEEGQTLSLGDKTLQFFMTPWVHWPETMVTYLQEDKILFSCDFFGSHLATSDLFAKDKAKTLESAKRYYAEIMMPFRNVIKNNLKKTDELDINVIAPSHGPLFDEPEVIIKAYKEWVSDDVKNQVVLPYVSMHGSTKQMVDYLTNALVQCGITVKPFNLTHADVGELAMALVDAATIVIGAPTMLVGPHPKALYAAYLANALRPKTRFVSVIGSYGWGSKMVEQLQENVSSLDVEFIEPVVVKGLPRKKDFDALDALADAILKNHEKHNIA
jgi:flavorubredoxin